MTSFGSRKRRDPTCLLKTRLGSFSGSWDGQISVGKWLNFQWESAWDLKKQPRCLPMWPTMPVTRILPATNASTPPGHCSSRGCCDRAGRSSVTARGQYLAIVSAEAPYAGERVVLLGQNGSGKTTLLAHILGLLTPVEEEVRVFGLDPARDFRKIRCRLGVVLQDVDEQIIGPTVWDDIALASRNHGLSADTVEAMVEHIMEKTGIAHLKHKIPHYLSGGEKKKVALAAR